MAFLQDLFDASIPGQRINAAREQRAAREAAAAERERQAKAFEAIQGGDVLGAAAYAPDIASQYQNVAAGEDQRSTAQDALRRQAGLRATRAVKTLAPKFGGDYGAAFDFVAEKSGGLFGSPEELASAREFVIQNGDEGLAAIEAGFSEPGAPEKRYYTTSGGLYDAEQGIVIEGTGRPGKEADPLLAEKRALIQAQTEAAKARATATATKSGDKGTEKGQATLSNTLSGLAETYLALADKGGIVVPGRTAGENLRARAESSGVGQAIGGAVGAENQSIRKRIKNLQPVLINAIRQATGMSAKALDSNAELKFYLQAATDPESGDLFSNLVAIDTLDQTYGLGGVLDNVVPPEVLAQVRAQTAPQGQAAEPNVGDALTPDEQAELEALKAELGQ